MHDSQASKRRGAFVLRRRALLCLFGGFVCLLTLSIPQYFPKWNLSIIKFFRTNLPFVGTMSLTLLFLLLWKLPQWQVASIADEKDRLMTESGFRQTLAQIVGGAALLAGLYFTSQTLQVSREGQITDRFTKAIDQLGNKTLAIRLGGIYALERIAKDSEYDGWAVTEVLTTFVREQTQERFASSKSSSTILFPKNQEVAKLPADIQAILTVLGQRMRIYGQGTSSPLNLSRGRLQQADLKGADLQQANLWGADLQQANLGRADLQQANLRGANLQETYLEGANLQQANLEGANLTKTRQLTQDQVNVACVDDHTRLPKDLTKPAPCPTIPPPPPPPPQH